MEYSFVQKEISDITRQVKESLACQTIDFSQACDTFFSFRMALLFEMNGAPELADEWLEKAIEQGSAEAKIKKAHRLYFQGDHEAARRLYKESADAGVSAGFFYLAVMSYNAGQEEEAFHSLISAKELCNPEARRILSYLADTDASARDLLDKLYFKRQQECSELPAEIILGEPLQKKQILPKELAPILRTNEIRCEFFDTILPPPVAIPDESLLISREDSAFLLKLGGMFWIGNKVRENRAAAIRCFRLAAAEDMPVADYCSGLLLLSSVSPDDPDFPTAVDYMLSTARKGNIAGAQYILGLLYETGLIPNGTFENALTWYALAAQQGNLQLQCRLANEYFIGSKTKQNYAQALYWYKAASAQGDVESTYMTGKFYDEGLGTEKNLTEAIRYFQIAAENGRHEAQLRLGNIFFYGEAESVNYPESLHWYSLAAEAGLEEAQMQLALLYDQGLGVIRDPETAGKWYRAAAQKGVCKAQVRLGDIFYNGTGVEANPAEAARWYEPAAKQGDAHSQNLLAGMYFYGNGVARDRKAAEKWYRKAAEQGMPEAQYSLACLYRDTEQNHSIAAKWFREAAHYGNQEAQYELGRIYSSGTGVPVDLEESAFWFRKVAEKGHAPAQCCLGNLLRAFSQSKMEAVSWYRKAAEAGNEEAVDRLAELLYEMRPPSFSGEELVQWLTKSADHGNVNAQRSLGELFRSELLRPGEAVGWYQKAAAQGDIHSLFTLGEMYRDGNGVGKDIGQAVSFFSAAAEKGNVNARYYLAEIYNTEYKDLSAACEWYLNAAKQGHLEAQLRVGLMYLRGEAVSISHADAFKWLQKAAERGCSEAQFNLGMLFLSGKGVKQDEFEAKKWFLAAAEKGENQAQEQLLQLVRRFEESKKETQKALTPEIAPGIILELEWLPCGLFQMGSPLDEPQRNPDEILHPTEISYPFGMGKYPVTQYQYRMIMGKNPSAFEEDSHPVETVSWTEAVRFCQILTERAGASGILPEKYVYTLPTEAMWEYACRAGTSTPFHTGMVLDATMANFNTLYPYGNTKKVPSPKSTKPVGSYKPNAWGLYDMHGNVMEWCYDFSGKYPSCRVKDFAGPRFSLQRVLRGGSWQTRAGSCRSACRAGISPDAKENYIGFRVALARFSREPSS